MVSARGFSLIELMVVVALLAFLLMLAVPFTNTWSANAKLRDAENQLHQGVGRAKALALRNHAGMTNNQAVAKLCIKNDTSNKTLELKLYHAEKTALGEANKPAKCYSADQELIWQANPSNKVSIEIEDIKSNRVMDFTCLAFDSRGLQIDLTDSDNCQKGSEYTLSIGDDNVKVTLN